MSKCPLVSGYLLCIVISDPNTNSSDLYDIKCILFLVYCYIRGLLLSAKFSLNAENEIELWQQYCAIFSCCLSSARYRNSLPISFLFQTFLNRVYFLCFQARQQYCPPRRQYPVGYIKLKQQVNLAGYELIFYLNATSAMLPLRSTYCGSHARPEN